MWHTSQCAGTDQRGTIRKKFPPKGDGWDRWHERNRRHSAQNFAEEFYSDWTRARITYPSRIARREKKKKERFFKYVRCSTHLINFQSP